MSDDHFIDPYESDQEILDYLSDLLPEDIPADSPEERAASGVGNESNLTGVSDTEAMPPEAMSPEAMSPEAMPASTAISRERHETASIPDEPSSVAAAVRGEDVEESATAKRHSVPGPAAQADRAAFSIARSHSQLKLKDELPGPDALPLTEPLRSAETSQSATKPWRDPVSRLPDLAPRLQIKAPLPLAEEQTVLQKAVAEKAKTATRTETASEQVTARPVVEPSSDQKVEVTPATTEPRQVSKIHRRSASEIRAALKAKILAKQQNAMSSEIAAERTEQPLPADQSGHEPDQTVPLKPEGSPAWSANRFECLLFHVDGLKLAVPLISLGGVYAIEKDLKPLFGMPGWFLGMFDHNGTNIKVVDSAAWVMPERYREKWQDDIRYVVRLRDSDWALACNSVDEAFTLEPEQVKWRTERSKRPWLAGTVLQHMCALIDVDGFAELLQRHRAG